MIVFFFNDQRELSKVISPFCVFSLDLLPWFVDLNVLVAMARDVEDVFQRIAESDETFKKKGLSEVAQQQTIVWMVLYTCIVPLLLILNNTFKY